MRIQMNFSGNRGYTADQIDTPMRLDDLLVMVQEAVEEWGEDAEVVMHQTNNGHGANYGHLERWADLFDSITCPECDGVDSDTCPDC